MGCTHFEEPRNIGVFALKIETAHLFFGTRKLSCGFLDGTLSITQSWPLEALFVYLYFSLITVYCDSWYGSVYDSRNKCKRTIKTVPWVRSKHKKVQKNAYLLWHGHTICKFLGHHYHNNKYTFFWTFWGLDLVLEC